MAENPSHSNEVILHAFKSEPSREWTAQALIDTTGLPVIEVMVALPHLTYRGDIKRVSVGRYRSNTATAHGKVS